MGKKFWVLIVLIGLLVCAYFYLHRERGRALDETRTVFIKRLDGRNQLNRNGKPFYIKGASGKSYLKELSEAGGNTLRVYDTINLNSILEEAKKYDIAVIVDIPLPANVKYNDHYSDAEYIKITRLKIRKLVRKYKDHSSLLIWNLGNELNYPLSFKKNDFVNEFNQLVDLIHEEDPNHLVSTTISGTSRGQILGMHLNSPKLDLIGFNVFGNIPQVQPLMAKISIVTNAKPYYMMEWGNHGPWEAPLNLWESKIEPNSTAKGIIYKDVYEINIKPDADCLGSLAFYWGYKHEGTPTWFNIFDASGRKSEVYYTLKTLWSEKEMLPIKIPTIEKMTLNSMEDTNQIFNSDGIIDVQIYLEQPIDSTYSFQWNLYKEAWGYQDWTPESDSLQIEQTSAKYSNQLKFKVPSDEGPYRIIVSVNDAQGNFSTANIPFYVLLTQ